MKKKLLLEFFYYFQLAPKPTITQVTGSAPQGQQQRFIIPAITPNLTNTNTNLQFPHGVISGGVVYLPQVRPVYTCKFCSAIIVRLSLRSSCSECKRAAIFAAILAQFHCNL